MTWSWRSATALACIALLVWAGVSATGLVLAVLTPLLVLAGLAPGHPLAWATPRVRLARGTRRPRVPRGPPST